MPDKPDEIREYFERAASDEEHYPSSVDPHLYFVKVLLDHLGESPQRIADLGSGKGRFARLVKDRHPQAQVVALDIAEAMLARVPKDIATVAARLTSLPFASESLDAAYAIESLEHAVDIPLAVQELTRVVKPGGRILIIDKNAKAWGRLETPAWEKWFHEKELSDLLVRDCRNVVCRPISYWEDVPPDQLFLVWLAEKRRSRRLRWFT